MPTIRLTDAAISRLRKPETGRVEYWDSHTRGLGLRLSASGSKSWVLITRTLRAGEWKQQRVTLGSYPALPLAQARKAADKAKAAAKTGADPADTVKTQRKTMVDDSRNTYAVVVGEFLRLYRGRQNRRLATSTLGEMTRVLSADDFAAWRDIALAKLTKRDVLDVLDAIVERGAETMANRTLSYLKLLFGWATTRSIIKVDPTIGIKKPGHETSRDRVLSLDELGLIWHATAGDNTVYNPIIRLLLLTGARLREVTDLPWQEIDIPAATWTLPAARAKNKRAHVVPLSAPAVAILTERKATQKARATKAHPAPKLAFTTNGETPFSGFSRAKTLLNRRIAKAGGEVGDWRPHDLRRSVATHMAETLRIAPHVIEATLNHVSGSKAGVAGVYNRALHLDERRAALEAWSDFLLRHVGEVEATNVVEIGARAAAR